jgi:ABC-type glycerol-3-phosphate transport system permease component
MLEWILGSVLLIVIVLTIVPLLLTRFKITRNSIRLGKFPWVNIPFRNIEVIQLNEKYPKVIRRVNGYDSGNIKIGIFEKEDGRHIQLHIYQQYPPFIEIFHRDRFGHFVFNSLDPEKTEQLYQELKSKV